MRQLLLILSLAGLCCACTSERPRHIIGVSQCSQDIWREKQNDELQIATYFNDDVELRFTAAYDNDERQVQQIDSLVATGIDLLIVAPNQIATITPAIDRAYDRGIPVIVFERKTDSKKYTAFISADNYEMGRQMGQYIAGQLHGSGRVLEVKGLKGSSPALERHKGFSDAIATYPGITLVASLQGDWTEESGYKAVRDYQGDLSNIDFVFGQNDRMAVGARRAMADAAPGTDMKTRFCGIDGLPGKDGGIDCVQRGILDATYIYPTRGDLLLKLAMDILEGRPYERENRMEAAIVTSENANVTQMQAEEMSGQKERLEMLSQKVDWYLSQYRHQQIYTLLLGIIVLLVVAGACFAFITMRRRHQLEREAYALVVSNTPTAVVAPLSSPEGDTNVQRQGNEAPSGAVGGAVPTGDTNVQRQGNEAPSGAVGGAAPTGDTNVRQQGNEAPSGAVGGAVAPLFSDFLELLRQHVQEHISDSDFSVETLAADMSMSRVQLYRKVKQLTGHTPVDIIRQSRLNRAKLLLTTTDLTISEVTYQVGFTAPSYFTKCFKEEFGYLPGDARKS